MNKAENEKLHAHTLRNLNSIKEAQAPSTANKENSDLMTCCSLKDAS